MATLAHPNLMHLWQAVEEHVGAGRVKLGGIVPGNMATELRHSYHRSWDDSPHDGGYSVHYSGDRSLTVQRKLHQYAAAIDLTFPAAEDMRRATARFHQWAATTSGNWTGLVHSPWLREVAGTLDSAEVFALDLSGYRRPVRTYGWDSSHLYHVHVSINRARIADPGLIPVVLSALGDW